MRRKEIFRHKSEISNCKYKKYRIRINNYNNKQRVKNKKKFKNTKKQNKNFKINNKMWIKSINNYNKNYENFLKFKKII